MENQIERVQSWMAEALERAARGEIDLRDHLLGGDIDASRVAIARNLIPLAIKELDLGPLDCDSGEYLDLLELAFDAVAGL